jgi:hypothetical protein
MLICDLLCMRPDTWPQLDLKRRDADPDGAGLVDEEEFAIVKSMKEKKKMYRDSFEELKQIKSEVEYLNRLVDQCRSKLVLRRPSLPASPVFSLYLRRRFLTLSNGSLACTLLSTMMPLRPPSALTASRWTTVRPSTCSRWNASSLKIQKAWHFTTRGRFLQPLRCCSRSPKA